MKIRQVFNIDAAAAGEFLKKSHWLVTSVPIVYTRERHIVQKELNVDVCENNIIGGSLFNFRYVPSRDWWFEVTTGYEKETSSLHGTTNLTVCRAGFDDVVVSAGRNTFWESGFQTVLYGVLGFPSKREITAQEVQNTLVGTRFFAIGTGGECSYAFKQTLETSLVGIVQARLLHFFDREWFPILPRTATLQPGNVTDVLLAGRYRYRRSVIEIGYNATVFTDQAIITAARTTTTPHFTRNAGYVHVTQVCNKVPWLDVPLIIGTGINFARSDRFDTKISSWWLDVSLLF